MKKIFILIVALLMAACDVPRQPKSNRGITVCLDGVKYYSYARGYAGYMSPKINKETLQPERCKDDKDR